MKFRRSAPSLVAVLLLGSSVSASNPLLKVLEMLEKYTAKLTQDGEKEAKAMRAYTEWCSDMAKENDFETKTVNMQSNKLTARIEKLTGEIETADSKISDLASEISAATDRLTQATAMRKQESTDFAAREKELLEVADMLGRAGIVLEKQMQKGSSFAQLTASNSDFSKALESITAVVDAAGISVVDRAQLLALTQDGADGADDGDDAAALSAPDAAAYETHSSSILETLENMRDKAMSTLSDLRQGEVDAKHAYSLLKQSLDDKNRANTKELTDVKTGKAEAQESKAVAEGDLQVTEKDLTAAKNIRELANARCMKGAADHDLTVKARDEELKAIADATKILKETTGGAAEQTYSFLQTSASSESAVRNVADWAKAPALIKQLARRHHSAALAQLASRISAIVRYSRSSGESPFTKVKGLITDLIAKLESEAASETQEKEYCDKEMAKTKVKKEELDEDVQKLTVKMEQAVAASTELQSEVKELQEELAASAAEQAEANQVRATYHGKYIEAKADLEEGISGVRKALVILRDYYAQKDESAELIQDDDERFGSFMQQPSPPESHEPGTGAGTSIIGLLEVLESDFAKGLAEAENQESKYQDLHEKSTQERSEAAVSKEQDVKYKSKAFKSLDKGIVELTSDRQTASSEQTAVLEYFKKLQERCIAKPETYGERKARRESEIKGLQEALSVLGAEAGLLQQRGRRMRGSVIATDSV